jgi:hypothetical protein
MGFGCWVLHGSIDAKLPWSRLDGYPMNEPKRCLTMIKLHRKEKVVVSVNRVGMACGEAGKRSSLNGKNSSAKTRFFICHGGAWWMELWGW